MVEQEDMELIFPQAHQKNIYMCNNAHEKLTGNWQKDSYKNQNSRKRVTRQDGEKGIISGPAPLGGI